MSIIPSQLTTKTLIETTEIIAKEDARGYLGMSEIGEECVRKLWYNFHFASGKKAPEPRSQRIFDMGDYIEGVIIAELKRVGVEVYRYGDNGEKVELHGYRGEEQDTCVAVAGHFKGHTDGNALGFVEAPKTEHLLECKSHNDKNFKALVKDRVQKAFPKHYAQMQIYLHYRKLTRAMYVGMNKNDCELYFERIKYDKDYAEDLVRKAHSVIMSEFPPARAFDRNWFACKWCPHFDICHDGAEPVRGCRVCGEVNLCNEGKWECGMNDAELSIQEQLVGCEYFVKGWGL